MPVNNSKWTHKDKVNGKPQQTQSVQGKFSNKPNQTIIEEGLNGHYIHSKYEFGNYGYGKDFVKLLHVERNGTYHKIREYEVATHLRLGNQQDYLEGVNKDIIATDSQKNTVYVLAKKHGIRTPEEFGLLLCSHFLYTYKHVDEVEAIIEQYPWERLRSDGQKHNHAFVMSPSAVRTATVIQKRHDSPRINSGLRDLRVLKTTKSSFTNFIQDGYRTLPDAQDRIFSTVVRSNWDYSFVSPGKVDYDAAWFTVKDCILETFAGDPEHGIYSPSVQNTLYRTERMILDKIPQITRIEMHMPNKHYFTIDMSKFPSSVLEDNDNQEVYLPVDKPSGIIYAELYRRDINSKM